MLRAAVAFVLVAASFAASADGYVGGHVGLSVINDVCEDFAACEDDDLAFGTFLGYQFSRGFALEAHLMRLGVVTVPGAQVTADGLGANLLAGGRILDGEAELYVMGGMMRARAETEARVFGLRFRESFYETSPYVGVVLNLRARYRTGVRLQYMRYLGEDQSIDVLSAGLTFH